jgi:nicotinamidase-related amidase
MGNRLLRLPLTERSVHLCVDMQRIFSAEGPWPTPWMDRVPPVVDALAGRHPERTVFTRFVPPERPDEMPGHVAALLHMLARRDPRTPGSSASGANATACGALPPATVIDKTRYSAFAEPELVERPRQREADALIVSGSETDVCVPATVLDAVDIGYRVIVVRDAICSSSDEGHEMLMRLYHTPIYRADRDCQRGRDPRAVGVTPEKQIELDLRDIGRSPESLAVNGFLSLARSRPPFGARGCSPRMISAVVKGRELSPPGAPFLQVRG